MSDKLFDDFLKQKLGTYDPGAPMHVWERIKEKKEDERKWFFFLRRYGIIMLGLLAVTVVGYLSYTSLKSGIQNSKPSFAETAEGIQSNDQTVNTPQINNEITGKQEAKSENTNLKPFLAETGEGNDAINHQISNIPSLSVNEKNVFNRKNDAVSINKKVRFSFLNAGTPKNRKTDRRAAGFHLDNMNLFKNNNGNNYQTSADVKSNLPVLNLQLTDINWQLTSLPQFTPGNITLPNNKPTCPSVNGPRRNDLYVELYASPDFTMRSFSTPTGLRNYISKRKTVEDNRNGFSAGIRLSKSIGENTLLKVGLNYSQINERLKIVEENAKQITQIITIRTVIRGPGDTLFIRDTSYFEQTGTRYNTTYNRYRFIDIPVMFSYEFGNPDLVAFALNAGSVINITSFYRGKVLDTFLILRPITTAPGNGPNHWRSNIGIGIAGGLAVYKRLNERTQIFVEPYFRYNFKPVTQNLNLVNQRYNTTGVQFGFRYNLHAGRQRYKY